MYWVKWKLFGLCEDGVPAMLYQTVLAQTRNNYSLETQNISLKQCNPLV